MIILLSTFAVSAQPVKRPKLVIYISIDQMKAEYLDWYKVEFTGGFRRFLTQGTVFRNADLNYAPSETGPGHASLGTGAYPAHSGIISNDWFDPVSGAYDYCVQDASAGPVDGEGGGVSPLNLQVSGLADWWKQSLPGSKVIAASVKDRAAILMSGKHPDCAYWYDKKSGHMVTSDYYLHHLPDWVRTFNANRWVQHNLPAAWRKLLHDSVYAKYGPDELEGEQVTDGSTSFPHAYPLEKQISLLPTGPYGDAMVLDFARAAVRSEKLGQRGVSDLLIVSLSSTDYVGHSYGGNSHEMIDQLVRLDRSLGEFFVDMEKAVGTGDILFVLSADHAAMPLPEYTSTFEHKSARRVLVQKEIYPAIDTLDSRLQRELGTSEHLIRSYAFLNYEVASKSGVDSVSLEGRVKDGLLRIDGISEVFFRREIMDPANEDKPFIGYYHRGYFQKLGRDFIVLPREDCLFTTSATGTTHGTPYAYDTHIPMLFLGKGIRRGSITAPAHSVDIAPTIARIIGIPFPKTVDGVPRDELLR